MHHTAGDADFNTNSIDTSKANVRAIQNLHMDSRGWSDIGYHFLVDKLGNIFEGRSGSMGSLPRGAHDSCNDNSFGFNCMGNFVPGHNSPTSSQLSRLYDVVAWRMPGGFTGFGGGTYNGNPGVGYICGHRNVVSTACPGDNLYAKIGPNLSGGEMRTDVNKRIVGYNNPPYDFHTDTEGFTAAHSCTLAYGSGTVNIQQNGYDPYVHGPACNFAAQAGQVVYVRVWPQSTGSGCSTLHDMQVFWRTNNSTYWDAAKSSGIVGYTGLNNWKHIYLPLNSAWNSNIVQLRVDFDQNNSGIQWVLDQVEVRNVTQPPYTFSSNAQGWNSSHGLTALSWTNSYGWPGVIYADENADDPWITGPLCYISGASTHKVHVRVHIQNTTRTTHDMQLFWVNSGDVVWGGAKSCLVNYSCGDDQRADVYFPVGSNSEWNGHGIVTLRLDFDQTKETDHTTLVRYLVDTIEVQ